MKPAPPVTRIMEARKSLEFYASGNGVPCRSAKRPDNVEMTETPHETIDLPASAGAATDLPASAGPAGTALPPAADADAAPSLKFSSVGLSPILQRAVADQGYTTMTPIQAKAI